VLLPLLLPFAVLAVPFVDLLLAVVRRTGRPLPVRAGQGHLHHRLLEIGHSHTRAVLIMYFWTALLAFGGVAAPSRWRLRRPLPCSPCIARAAPRPGGRSARGCAPPPNRVTCPPTCRRAPPDHAGPTARRRRPRRLLALCPRAAAALVGCCAGRARARSARPRLPVPASCCSSPGARPSSARRRSRPAFAGGSMARYLGKLVASSACSPVLRGRRRRRPHGRWASPPSWACCSPLVEGRGHHRTRVPYVEP
jgi:hypothetical protein